MKITNTMRPVLGVTHPLIADMYLKKDFNAPQQDVLVIKTRNGGDDNEGEHDGFDSYLTELLADLEDLKAQVEHSTGSFDRVDICRA